MFWKEEIGKVNWLVMFWNKYISLFLKMGLIFDFDYYKEFEM